MVQDVIEKYDINDDKKVSKSEFYAYDPGLRKNVFQSLKKEWARTGVLGLDVESGQVRLHGRGRVRVRGRGRIRGRGRG